MKAYETFRKLFRLSGALVVSLLLVGIVYEHGMRWTSHRAFPPPGQLHDAGGHELHLDCRGVGTPTVVFEAGLDPAGSLSWSLVHDEVAEYTRACAYDRAGIMWSDRGPRPRSGETLAAELSALLEAAGEAGDLVLVGHSIGGVYMRAFAERQRESVAGMVFIDSSHPEQQERIPAEMRELGSPPAFLRLILTVASRTGMSRFLAGPPPLPFPEPVLRALARFAPQSGAATFAEADAIATTAAAARDTGPYGAIPIIVLTRGDRIEPEDLPPGVEIAPEVLEEASRAWLEMQLELADLSSESRQETVDGAGHYIHVDRPDIVVAAIREVVDTARER